MKRWCAAWMIVFCLFLTSCSQEKTELSRLVVKAEVRYTHEGQTILRCYTDPQELSQILMGLQLPDFAGLPTVNPESIIGDDCKVKLTYHNGTTGVILQQANRYRSVDFHAWEQIDHRQAEKLYPILEALPGDVSQT